MITVESSFNLSHMLQALNLAKIAFAKNQVPVGAVIINGNGLVVGRGYNCDYLSVDSTAHAEMVAIKQACKLLKQPRLDGCALYTTLEPCLMCFGAILIAHISKLYYGATNTKNGVFSCFTNLAKDLSRTGYYQLEVYSGIQKDACAKLLQDFFTNLR